MIEKELFRFELIKPAKIDKNKINTNGGIQELVDVEIRSCENCFYFNSKYKLLDINNSITNRCEKLSLYVTDDFYCNKWSKKNA